jgi:hypothetical protein
LKNFYENYNKVKIHLNTKNNLWLFTKK